MLAFLTVMLGALLPNLDLERRTPDDCYFDHDGGFACVGDEGLEEAEWPTIDLARIAHDPFVKVLSFGRAHIRDFSVVATLPSLTKLELFDLGDQRFDLAPIIARGRLTSLSIEGDSVTDIRVVADAKSVITLRLEQLAGVDLGFLADLPRLEHLLVDTFERVRWGTRPWPSSLKELHVRRGPRSRHASPDDRIPLGLLPEPCRLATLALYWLTLADSAALSRCTELTKLSAIMTDLDTTAPLAGLTRLEELDLVHTEITAVDGLAGMGALRSLRLAQTKVTDLTPIAGLTRLSDLDLAEMKVTDLAPLRGLTALESLRLYLTPVADISPLAGLPKLESLNLEGTRVANLQPLMNLPQLRWLDLRSTPAIQSDDLGDLKRARPKVIVETTSDADYEPVDEPE